MRPLSSLLCVMSLVGCTSQELQERIVLGAIANVADAFEGQAPTLDATLNFWGQGVLVFTRPAGPGDPCVWIALYA